MQLLGQQWNFDSSSNFFSTSKVFWNIGNLLKLKHMSHTERGLVKEIRKAESKMQIKTQEESIKQTLKVRLND